MTVIEQVHEGMQVFSRVGKKIGKVEDVKLPEPDATIDAGTDGFGIDGPNPNFVRSVLDNNEQVPIERAERLIRQGFVQVNGTGIGNHFYVEATRLDHIEGEDLYLRD